MSAGSELLQRLLSSGTKGDLLVLFHKNPGLIDDLDGVARRIGKVAKAVEADVKDLVDLGVLATKRVGNSEAIFLNREKDKEVQDVVENYLKGLKTSG